MVDIDYKLDEPWTILSAIEQSIKKKIESIGTPLKDWDIRINYGIKTGLNDAFIISKEKRDELVKADPKSDEIIRPILRGKDIGRNTYTFADLYVITAYKGISLIMKETYPAVFEHLKQFEEKLRKRGQCEGTATSPGSNQHHWLELDNNVSQEKLDDFLKPKIVWGNLNLRASFALAPAGMFVSAPSPILSPASDYLLAVLNSKVADYYIRSLGVVRNGGYFEYKPMFVQQLPVPKVDENTELKFSQIILNEDLGIADDLIYEMYDLNQEEIDFISKA